MNFGILLAKYYDAIIVHPKTWQSKLLKDINAKNTKVKSILLADRIYNTNCGKDDGKADALNLAYYGFCWLI